MTTTCDFIFCAYCKLYLITTLSIAPSCSSSEYHEQAQFFSHLITTFLPLWI